MKNILKFTSINSFDFNHKIKINEFDVETRTLINQNYNLSNMISKKWEINKNQSSQQIRKLS